MAKNNGIIKPQGTLEDLTFYKTQDGHLIRTKGGVSKSRIMTDPAFARTRENMSEFAESAASGKVLRRAASSMMQNASDNRVTSRLAQTLHQVLKEDSTHLRGARTVAEGLETAQGKALLQGFNFNKQAPLEGVLKSPYQVDPVTFDLSFTDFIPGQHLSVPSNATHVSLQAGIAEVDFNSGAYNFTAGSAELLPIDMTPIPSLVVEPGANPGALPGASLLVYLLVEFSQQVNGEQYPIGSNYNALGIVHVGTVG